MRARIVGAAIALLVLGVASGALGQARRVTVAELEGRGAATARRVIVDGLDEEGYELVDEGADATIAGSAVARGSRWRVDLTVRDAAGAEAGQVRMRVAGRRGVRRLVARLDGILEGMSAAGAGEAAPSPAAEAPAAAPAEGIAADDAAEDAAAPEPAAAAAEDARAAPAAPATADAGDELPIRALAQVGAGIRTRAIELRSPDGVNAAYRAEPYVEVTARGEARFFDVAFVRAAFGTSVGLSSEREDATLPPLDTLFVWLRADAGASYVIDQTVELGAAFGVGWERYELAFNELVPTAEYLHLRPALLTGFLLVGRQLVLDAELGFKIPFGVGDLASVYGVDHEAFGVDGAIRLHGVIDPGFAWAVEAGFRHWWLTFAGAGGEVSGHDAGWHVTGWAGWRF